MPARKRTWAAIGALAAIGTLLAALYPWHAGRAHTSSIVGLQFHADSLVSAGFGDGVKVWDMKIKELSFESSFRWSTVDEIFLLPSSGRLVLGGCGSEGGLRLGAVPGELKLIEGGYWEPNCVLSAHEGANKIVVGYPKSSRNLARILDMGTGRWEEVLRPDGADLSDISAICFSDDGKTVILGLETGRVHTIDIQTLSLREAASLSASISALLPLPSKPFHVIVALVRMESGVFVQDEATGDVIGSKDRTVCRLNFKDGDVVPVGNFGGPVDVIAQCPNGKYLSWSNIGGGVILYDLVSGQQRAAKSPGTSSASVTCLAFSPDGKMLATGDVEGRIHIWSVPGLRAVELK